MTRFIELTNHDGNTFHLDANRMVRVNDTLLEPMEVMGDSHDREYCERHNKKAACNSWLEFAVGSKIHHMHVKETRAGVLAKIEALDKDEKLGKHLTAQDVQREIDDLTDKFRRQRQLQNEDKKTPPGST